MKSRKQCIEELLDIIHSKIKYDEAGSLPDLCDLHGGRIVADRFIRKIKETSEYKKLIKDLK